MRCWHPYRCNGQQRHRSQNSCNAKWNQCARFHGTIVHWNRFLFSQLAAHFSHLPLSYHFFLPKMFFFDCAVRNEYWLIAFSLSFYSIRFDSICHHHLILFPFNIYRGQCFRFGCYFILFIIWHQYEFRITSTHSALNAKRFRYNMFRYERYCCAFH